jgi:archaellum component FlaG (FlaF/FlaG flagellin family)
MQPTAIMNIRQTECRFRNMVVTVFIACAIQSCSVIRTVQVDAPTWTCATAGQTFCNDTVVRTNIWKGMNNMKINAGCANGISRVKVTTKPGDVFLGFVTLGLYVRQRIEWDCAQRSGSNDM